MTLSRQKLTLIGIFALFMGPVFLVMLMRSSWWDYQPAGMKNNGFLVQPPVPIVLETGSPADRKWRILFVLESPCETACLEEVTALRQIHRAAGRHAENLEIVLISQSEPSQDLRSQLESIYPAFRVLGQADDMAFATLESINQGMPERSGDFARVHTYVADPNSNVILAYRADADPNDLHKDLKRLLKWSDQES
jgi:hypothetical protein